MSQALHSFVHLIKINKSLLVGLLVLVYGVSWGQNADDYRTRQSGNWNQLTTWERFNGTTWQNLTGTGNLTIPNSTDGDITIRNTHAVSITANTTVDQVVVESGGQVNLNSNVTLTIANGTGTDFLVEGTFLRSSGTITVQASASLAFGNTGIYTHAQNGGIIPTATWAANSTVQITGTTTSDPTGLNQSFGNFIWNATGLGTNSINFNPTGVAGDLIINNGTATGQIILTVPTLSIGGDLIIQGGGFRLSSGNNQTRNIEIAGNFEMSGGTFLLSANNGSIGNVSVAGNFSHTSGTINETANGSGNIVFNGSGSPQIFTSGGTVSNTINWTVNSGAFLQMAGTGSTVTGGGAFTLSSGATLGITSGEGITTTAIGTIGNIQVTGTRTYNSGANYIYNGNVNQVVGNGLPGTVNSLTISNTGLIGSNIVTLDADKTITTNLSIISGTFNLQAFTANRVSPGGTLTLEDNTRLIIGGSSNFPINYTTNFIGCTSTVEYNASGNQTIVGLNFGNLTLSGSGVKSFQSSTTQICSNFTLIGTVSTTAITGLTIGGNLTIGTGTSFSAGAFSHQVGGNWTNQGTFNAGTSTFNFAGPSPGTITNSGTGDFFTISFGGLGTKTIASNLSPTGNIQQVATALVFSGSSTLTLSTGRSMEVNASGSVSTGSGRIILQPGSLYINRSSSNPTLEVRQNLTGNRGWRMIGSPVSSTYSAFTSGFETQGFPGSTNPSLQPNLLWWDETDKGTSLQSWRQPTNLSNTVPAGRGHYFYVFNGDTKPGGGNYSDALPKNLSVTGTEVNLASSFFDFGVTYTPRDSNLVAQADTLIEVNQANEGFNLIANPTASVIDFYASSGWNKTNIDQTIYVWDPSVGEFLTWNGSTGTLGHGRIQPFQAFWVKANAPSPILRLTGNGAKSFISAGFYGRKMEDSNPVLELNVAGEGLRAQSLISFGQDGKEGADPKDAYQLESLAENWLLLYSFGSTKTKSPLVINHQPQLAEGQSRIIPLHLAASKKGEPFKGTYLMDWKLPLDWNPETEIVLMDHINQKAIDMRKENLYSFNFEAPKLPLSNSRKNSNGMSIPQAVVFQTPYEIGQEEEVSPNLIHSRSTSSTKPRRPFSIYIGSFPNGQVEYLPELPKLFAPSPNPFSKETKIRFYLPSPEMAELVIYNLMGQEVAKFPAQVYEAGIQELVWTPSAIDLQTGMYIIRLTTSSGQFTQKLIKN